MKLLVREYPDYECGHDIEVLPDDVDEELEFKEAVEKIKRAKMLCRDHGYIVYLCEVKNYYSD